MTHNFNLFSFINCFNFFFIPQDFYFTASLSQNTAILGRVLSSQELPLLLILKKKKKENGAGIRKGKPVELWTVLGAQSPLGGAVDWDCCYSKSRTEILVRACTRSRLGYRT